MDKKTLRNDLILILSLVIIAVVALILVNATASKKNLVAKVYYRNEVVQTIDLEKSEDEEYGIVVSDKNGHYEVVKITVKDKAIAITESHCPRQDCVKTGYVKDSNHPIICAYYGLYIVIEGNSNYDTELG